ncbi:MAG: hypothetical protein PHW00_02775 [Clostridia bacterium]|nr:hypothetical protein [Clostridia bacterium]
MRQQSTSSLSYFFRNFFYLLPLCIVPSFLLGLSCTNRSFYTFVDFFYMLFTQGDGFIGTDYYNGAYKYFSFLNFSSSWWIWVIGWIVLFIACCVLFPMIEKHMRLGIRRYRRLSSYNFNILLVVMLYFLLMATYIECFNLITSAVVFSCYKVGLRGLSITIISAVMFMVDIFYILYAYTMTACAIPSKLMDNYNFNIAVSYSIQLVAGKYWSTYAKILAGFMLSIGVASISKYLFLTYSWYLPIYHTIILTMLFLFWLMMFCIFGLKTYISLTDGQRRDLSTSLFNR